ncbi:sensor histidine kinase [Algoriphagus confluentis]
MGVSLIFDTWERNFSPEILLPNTVSKILEFIVYGGFYLTFLLFKENKKHNQKISSYKLAVSESRFAQLKQQLNPHFLFNNLNILDQLIEENPKTASSFLHNFSELYRYALDKSTTNLVDWQEELEFAKNYHRLIKEKYGSAYQLNLSLEHPKGKIPPLTLQLLIENAVLHNFGTEENPVFIELYIGKNIRVSNNQIPFKNPKHKGGRGLQNLKEQIQMLSVETIVIQQTNENFSVTLPLIPN